MKRKRKKIISNDAAVAEPPAPRTLENAYQRSVFQTMTKLVRNDEMEGRQFTVVPMVMIVEGVLNGSNGPLLYSAEELGDVPAVWNHKPVVVYHPQLNGQGISACDPDVITNYKVGVIMNTKFKDGRLTAEAWLEQTRIEKVDNRVGEAIANGQMMELSTGLYSDVEYTEGEFNGRNYVGIVRNIRPDHLALLPDQIGACSISDGAGFMRNQESGKAQVCVTVNFQADALRVAVDRAKKALSPYILVGNELSHEDTRAMLHSALRTMLQAEADPDGWVPVWVEDVFDTYVVYEMRDKYFKINYTATESGVSLEGTPEEVRRVTSYEPVTAPIGNASTTNNQKPKHIMDKKTIVNGLIKNKNTKWADEDREFLMGLEEDQLAKLEPVTNAKTEEPPPSATPAAPVANKEEPKPQTVDDFIANAPSGIRDVLRSSIAVHNQQKHAAIETILANERNQFTREQLEAKELQELHILVNFAKREEPKPQPYANDYSAFGAPAPRTNSAEPEEGLELPVINFGNQE